MQSNLSDAYYGVCSSSKEILKKNHRHLYCNMLDLLSNTIKTTGIPTCQTTIDDLTQFWFGDILPLMFDDDRAIQSSAIAALEQGLTVAFDLPLIHNSSTWAELKKNIVGKYTPLLHKLREARNSNWQKIWCILVRIFDNEVLKGASTINTFLSVVELGFRSSDNTVRLEAFYCWRQLIQTFFTHKELSYKKRLKLVCIPLKSSQSKSPYIATIKMRVWWYLITCLGTDLKQYFEGVIEPFLTFSFGSKGGNASGGAAHLYDTVRELSLPCMVALLADESIEFLQRLLRDHELETLCQPSPLLSTSILHEQWESILHAALEAVRLLSHSDTTLELTEHQLLNLLLRLVLNALFKFAVVPCIAQFFSELAKMMPTNSRPAIFVLNMIASEGLPSNDAALKSVANDPKVLDALMHLINAGKASVPHAILQSCIQQGFSVDSSHDSKQQWRQLTTLTEIVMQSDADVDHTEHIYETKLMAWKQISQAMIKYLLENRLEYRAKENANIINRWLLWPLRNSVDTARQADTTSTSDKRFPLIWAQILTAGYNAPNRRNFLNEVKEALQELLARMPGDKDFADLLEAYSNALHKLGPSRNSTNFQDYFQLVIDALEYTEQKKFTDTYLKTVRIVVYGLKLYEVPLLFDLIKSIVKIVMPNGGKCNAFQEEWKRGILEKLRSHSNKSFVAQIKALFQDKDDFVTIPTVWSLNPDKLTDRQKERFAEKADIPALYNDMSRSQDSSMKAWTPKKIVIATGEEVESAIGESQLTELPTATSLSASSSKKNACVLAAENTKRTRSSAKALQKRSTGDAEPMAIIDNVDLNPQSQTIQTIDNISPKGSHTKQDLKPQSQTIQTIDNISPTGSHTKQASTKDQPQQDAPLLADLKSGSSMSPVISTEINSDLKSELNQTQTSSPSDAAPKEDVGIQRESMLMEQNEDVNAVVTPTTTSEVNHEQEQSLQQSDEDPASAPEHIDVIMPKEVSPKKTKNIPPTVLTSPPDRKLTNNNSSPTLRHKPSPHLTGRGAQLINMIRNKKIDVSGQSAPPRTLTKAFAAGSTPKSEAVGELMPSIDHLDFVTTEHHASTPIQPKDLLIFSKRLPSPTASPSVSILKRKMRLESIEDTPIETSASKRKRVSFHDPPVSITKEYVRDSEECKLKPKRALILDKIYVGQDATSDAKYALKRRSKLDSMEEIENFASRRDSKSASGASADDILANEVHAEEICEEICSAFAANPNADTTMPSSSGSAPQTTSVAECSGNNDNITPAIVLDNVVQNCSIEMVLDKFFSVDPAATMQAASSVTKYLSKYMSEQPKIKTLVLETLCENHSKEYLDHAIQENLSSVVCDRLNLSSVIDYVCTKSKLNTNCRNSLLEQMPEVLKHTKSDTERAFYIENVLRISNFTDETIVNFMKACTDMRSRTASAGSAEIVSESAVDSSSNL